MHRARLSRFDACPCCLRWKIRKYLRERNDAEGRYFAAERIFAVSELWKADA